MAILRDTRGSALTQRDRFNHFPVSPYCALTWYFQGENRLIETDVGADDPLRATPLPQIMASGPTQHPVTMFHPGEVHALTIGFYPDAWQVLTGIPVETMAGHNLAADDIMPIEMRPIVHAVLESGSAQRGFDRFQDAIADLWAGKRPRQGVAPFWLRDWTTSLAVRAVVSGTGRSVRQVQRRIRRWTGRTQRDLALLARNEELFALVMSREAGSRPDYAGLAAEMGYADQAHMVREVRRITGVTPGKFVELVESEESFWLYRLLGEHFS
jgi:AraC-like DNA-binding protein